MKKILKLALIAALASGSYSTVQAQERGEMLDRLFSKMDRNNDGVIEKSEAPDEFWARFSDADANKDGKIEKAEAKEGMKSQMGGRGAREGAKSDPKKGEKPAGSRNNDANKPERSGPPDREGAEKLRQLFEKLKKDGKIALADVPAPMRERLAKLDTNSDATIEQSELKGKNLMELLRDGNGDPMEGMRRMMQALDKDGDGKVALEDIPGDFKTRLAKLDTNGDGMLERSEMAELRNVLGDGKGEGKGGPSGGMMDRMQAMFKQFDKDGDGKIVLTDIPEQARERVAKLDSNDDGIIEKSELRGAMEDKRSDGKPGEGKLEGRYGNSESTAPQDPKRPDSK